MAQPTTMPPYHTSVNIPTDCMKPSEKENYYHFVEIRANALWFNKEEKKVSFTLEINNLTLATAQVIEWELFNPILWNLVHEHYLELLNK